MKLSTNALLILSLIIISASPALAGDSWEKDLAMADSLYDNGYYEAAIEDYLAVATNYTDPVALDKAFAGLAKAYHVTGNTQAAKLAAEKCIKGGTDAQANMEARNIYRQMADEAKLQASETERALQYFERQYYSVSWLNIITKVFNYFDLRKARKKYTEAKDYADDFNPRYLIDPVEGFKISSETGKTEESPLKNDGLSKTSADTSLSAFDNPAGTNTGTSTSTSGDSTVQITDDTNSGAATSVSVSSDPNVVLREKRDVYLAAYRSLQDAMRGKNQLEIQRANEAFQKAVAEYKSAKAEVVAAQQ